MREQFTRRTALLLAGLAIMSACGGARSQSKDVVQETYIHKYGITVTADDWDKRGRDGQIVSTMRNGITISRSYNGGIQDGETSYSFPHSQIVEKVETYKRGQLTRTQNNYSSGAPMKEESILSGGRKQLKTWYEQGTPQSIEIWDGSKLISGQYFNLENEQESAIANGNGERIQRDAFGQFLHQERFEDGLLTVRTTYHLNGAPKEVIPFADNKIHGIKRIFTPAGEPKSTEEWLEGSQTGVTTLYQNGEKTAEIPYIEGERHGTELRFKSGSSLVQEITWRFGSKHGPTKTHFQNDTQTDWFFEGRLVSKLDFDELSKIGAVR